MTIPRLRKTTPQPVSIPPDNARCIIYRRVSTDDQAKDDLASLPEQERQCRAYATELGLAVDYVWDDLGVSGRDESRLERMASWCEQHPRPETARGVILVLKRDRWARFVHNDDASGFYAYRMARKGWDVAFALVGERRTGNKTADAVTATIHNRLSSEESEEKGRRARMGMLAQAKLGHWLGRPPFGYDRVATNTTTGRTRALPPFERAAAGERVTLTPSTRDARTVKRVFAEVARGSALEEVLRRLNKERVPGSFVHYAKGFKDGRVPQWTLGSLHSILANPVYLGQLSFGLRTASDGAPREDRVIIEGAWDPLVDRKTWADVQAIFARRKGQRRPRVVRYMLSGLVTCGQCGSRLTGGGGTRPKQPDPLAYTFYKCPRCAKPRLTVNRAWLERQVIEAVSAHVRAVVKGGQFDRILDEVLKAQRGQDRAERRDPAQDLRLARQQRDRVVEAIADGTLTPEEAGGHLDGVRRQIDALEALEAVQQQGRFAARRQTVSPRERKALKAMAENFPQRLAKADLVTARELLGYWLSSAYIDGKKRTGRLVLRRVPRPAGLAMHSEAGR